jgi:hypothetical protein
MRRFYEQTLCILHKFLLANQDLHHGLLAEKNGGKLPEKLSSMDVLDACARGPDVVPFDFGGHFRMGQWLDGVDEFYKDFRNKGLDVQLAMRYVKEQLHGKPAKELEDEVTEWRRSAAK